MACPTCNGTSSRPIADGLVECTSSVWYSVPTGAHPSGIQGPPYQQVSRPCGHRYHVARSGNGPATACYACTTDSIGSCARCHRRVCGDHSRQHTDNRHCSNCISELRAAQQRQQQERQQQVEQQNAEREAADLAAHERAVTEHESKQSNPNRRRREALALQRQVNGPEPQGMTAGTGCGCFAILFIPALVIAASIIKSDQGAYSPGAFTLGIVLAAVIPLLFTAITTQARARRNAARRSLEQLRSTLGCGAPSCARCATSWSIERAG